MSRDQILNRVRTVCRSADSVPLPAAIPEFPHYQDPLQQFRSELEQVSGVFLDGRGEDRLASSLRSVIADMGATELIWESPEIVCRHLIPHSLEAVRPPGDAWLLSRHPGGALELPVELRWEVYSRERVATAEATVSSAAAAIAETGTIVHQVAPGVGRILSVLAPMHLTLVSQKDMYVNHAQFFQSLQLGRSGSAMTLVTGPSRTADIEKTLVLGVHGPKRWYVIVTD